MKKLLIVIGLVIAVLIATITQSSAQLIINGCSNKINGALRIVTTSSDCKNSESFISWNQQGIQGPPGLQGQQGIQGPKGDKGDTGTTGLAGPAGPAGQAGPAGISRASFAFAGPSTWGRDASNLGVEFYPVLGTSVGPGNWLFVATVNNAGPVGFLHPLFPDAALRVETACEIRSNGASIGGAVATGEMTWQYADLHTLTINGGAFVAPGAGAVIQVWCRVTGLGFYDVFEYRKVDGVQLLIMEVGGFF